MTDHFRSITFMAKCQIPGNEVSYKHSAMDHEICQLKKAIGQQNDVSASLKQLDNTRHHLARSVKGLLLSSHENRCLPNISVCMLKLLHRAKLENSHHM